VSFGPGLPAPEGAAAVLAHGAAPPDPSSAFLAWPFEPLVYLGLVVAGWLYLRAARSVAGWRRSRVSFFLGGLAAAAVALASPLATYAEALFSVHMVQHLLLTLVAVPLVLLGAPGALLARSASPAARARWAAVTRSQATRFVTRPPVAWAAFALVMWVSHLSPLYNRALENDVIHGFEHTLYLGAALLFWWPVVGLDPGGRRLGWPLRIAYLVLMMPVQGWLGLVLNSSDAVLYDHYATLARSWGPALIDDQRLAAAIMWVGGDLLVLAAVAIVVLAWMRADTAEASRVDRRLGLRS
jgi:putative membrane protein